MKKNCWNIMLCGQEKKSRTSAINDSCPAPWCKSLHSINGGKNGGRYCWRVEGTCCARHTYITSSEKMMNCIFCQVYRIIKQEEGRQFQR